MSVKYSESLIFDIVRGSGVDGHGLRTVVFFKGCPLRCKWCHNPESHEFKIEIQKFDSHCISCGNCTDIYNCPDRKVIGKYYEPNELLTLLLKDQVYYSSSHGGVTFSGGEPLIHIEYLNKVVKKLKEKEIHVAFETSGYFNYTEFSEYLLDKTDLILFDLKIFDNTKHKEYTGVSNKLIIENYLKLLQSGIKIITRIPLIPNYTATEENLKQIAAFLKNNGVSHTETLMYNPSVNTKREKLGKVVINGLSDKAMTMEEEFYWRGFLK